MMMIRQAGLDAENDVQSWDEQIGGMKSLKRLFVMLLPYLPMLVLVFVMTLGLTGISILIPKLAGDLVDNSLQDINSVEGLNRVSVLLFMLITVMSLLRYFSAYHLGLVGARFLLKLRRRVFDHLIYLSSSFFERRHTGEINARLITNLETIQGLLTDYALTGVQTVVQIAGVSLILLYMNFELALIAMGACIPVVVLTLLFGKVLETSFLKEKDALANTAANVEEVLNGIGTVQAFGKEKEEIARYSRLMDKYLVTQVKVVKRQSLYMALMEFFGYAAIALVLWYGGLQILAGTMTIGELTSCLLYMFMFGMGIQELGELFANYSELKGISHRVFQLLDEKSSVPDHGTQVMKPSQRCHVEFSNVSFEYPSAPNKNILDGVSLSIDEGEDLSIVGPTGSGKSTLFKLLLRFYEPTHGQILLNNEPLSVYGLEDLRRHFGLVSQNIFLFSGSVLENVSYGCDNIRIKDVEKAIDAIGASEFVSSLENGLYEEVGVGGSRLSGGQKQLLAIARIYLRDPKIILLDEATSSLDSESERKVQQSLESLKKNRTSITIAHRLATVRESQKIILLKDGQIVAQGDHEYLNSKSELYRKYWEWQSGGRITPIPSDDLAAAH